MLRLSLRNTVPNELFAIALPLLTLPLSCGQQGTSIRGCFTITGRGHCNQVQRQRVISSVEL